MTDIIAFVEALGSLHDCTITAVRWEPTSRRITMDVGDIYSNFEGLPQYPGARPGIFTFSGVSAVSLGISQSAQRVSEFMIRREDVGYASEIMVWSGEKLKIRSADVTCDQTLAPGISASV